MKLVELLREEEKKTAERVLDVKPTPLLVGRPPSSIGDLRARASSDPGGLLSDLGIEAGNESDPINFLNNVYTQMVSSASGNDRAQLLVDFFKQPEIVASHSKRARGLIIQLKGDAVKEAAAAKSTKKILRTYAFWFSSVVTAITATGIKDLDLSATRYQYVGSENAIIIYIARKPWSSL